MTEERRNQDDLEDLYQELIIDHYRNPRNQEIINDPDVQARGFNPFCGDEIHLTLKIDEAGCIRSVGFQGQGCSISQASASMMTELLKGKTLAEVENLSQGFTQFMHGQEVTEDTLVQIGEMEALIGVRKFPIRIKCALLSWSTLEEGIDEYCGK